MQQNISYCKPYVHCCCHSVRLSLNFYFFVFSNSDRIQLILSIKSFQERIKRLTLLRLSSDQLKKTQQWQQFRCFTFSNINSRLFKFVHYYTCQRGGNCFHHAAVRINCLIFKGDRNPMIRWFNNKELYKLWGLIPVSSK